MTLMIYSLIEKKWRHVIQQPNPSLGTGGGGNNGAGGGGAGGGNNRGIRNAHGLPSFGAPRDDITVVAGSATEMDDVGAGISEREGEVGGRVSGGGILRPGRLHVSGTPPPGRNGHTATLATTGTSGENARIVIIGGWLGTGPLAASDMHVLDISGGVESLRWFQPVSSSVASQDIYSPSTYIHLSVLFTVSHFTDFFLRGLARTQ